MTAGGDGHGGARDPAILEADWPAPPGVHAFTTLRHGAGGSAAPFASFDLGARNGDDPAVVAANRAELRRRRGLPSAPHWLRQVHGTAVLRFDRPLQAPLPTEAEPEADAATTAVPGVVLAVLTADCLPVGVVLVDMGADGSEVAVFVQGAIWLAAGVLEVTVAAMHAAPGRLLAWLGPAAGPQAYEIGAEVFDAFVGADPQAAEAFVPARPGHWKVDLYALARRRLGAAGLAPGAIHGGGLCTISDPERFYSHRREQRTGRMATLAYIAPR
ncbi:polyphenol oxidase family protein [Pseudoxanthomonas taiwanensis]|uniref:Purine nucleoside phosphorylase n=1 Tax=Pseudoxanthomonas taiwanensis J19 TaxID=935569 RepID=A0A562DK82_9GAMM|nr:laccase domain-containing protein [Pseudoxanthomonas taiwanensis]TWH09957.1 hypothetical protein L613_003200000220 [Pseudoxanthomonas taiwanensis J19]